MDSELRRQTLADLLHRSAKRFPNKTAIICGDTAWSYATFDALCNRLATGLAARAVRKGTRVAILSRNSHGFAALRFALARLGAVLVPINFMLKAEEAAFILRHAGADMLATDSGLAETARAAAALDTKVREFIWLPSEEKTAPLPGMIAFDELLSNSTEPPRVELSGSDLAQIVYTSGTESLPKGTMLTHDAVIWQYVSCVVDANISSDDLALHALPLYHCAQLDVFLGPAIYVGSTNGSPPSRHQKICCHLSSATALHRSLRRRLYGYRFCARHSLRRRICQACRKAITAPRSCPWR